MEHVVLFRRQVDRAPFDGHLAAFEVHADRAVLDYGFAAESAEYDARIVELVRDNRLGALPELGADFAVAAKADSYWQMLMLHGALGDGWSAELLSYEVPTYFGMLCAAFTRT